MFEGYVALLDVLGFSSLVSGGAEETRLNRYLECVEAAVTPADVLHPIDYVVFSDSITLTTRDGSEESLQALLRCCSRTFGSMLREEIALRGAVAYGALFRKSSQGGTFVAGKAIVDAHMFETKQDWVGIMLAPSARKRIPDLNERCGIGPANTDEQRHAVGHNLKWAAFVQQCYRIPFHPNSPLEPNAFDGFAIVPSDGVAEPAALRDSLLDSLEKLKWLKSLAPDPQAQSKYDSCLTWLSQIQYRWGEVAWSFERSGQSNPPV